MLETFAKRKSLEAVDRQREAMITGIWANSNYDGDPEKGDNPRVELLKIVDESAEKARAMIRSGVIEAPEETLEDLRENPFFAAMQVPDVDEADSAQLAMLAQDAALYGREGEGQATMLLRGTYEIDQE